MKIAAIRVYQVDLPLVEGRYSWSEGKFVEVFDSTIVELITDDGLSGYGEVCPLILSSSSESIDGGTIVVANNNIELNNEYIHKRQPRRPHRRR